MGDATPAGATAAGEDAEAREQALEELAKLEDEFGRHHWEFGFDRYGWEAWREQPFGEPFGDELRAGTPGELAAKVRDVLGTAGPPC